MNHRLLAIDLDGTLLVGDQVPKPHLAALRAALDHGFKVVIATARWCQMAEAIQRNIGNSDLIMRAMALRYLTPSLGRILLIYDCQVTSLTSLERSCSRLMVLPAPP